MKNRKAILILPRNSNSGGNKIAYQFSKSIDEDYRIISFFKNNNESNKIKIFIIYIYRLIFISFEIILRRKNSIFILTHYCTLPLRLIPFLDFKYIYQDHEYKFVNNKLISFLLKILIILVVNSTQTITTSRYLQPPFIFKRKKNLIFPIWIDSEKSNFQLTQKKKNDNKTKILLVLRKGRHKNALFTEKIAKTLSFNKKYKISVLCMRYKPNLISRKDNIYFYNERSSEELIELYLSNSYLIYLSLHEGFGLMPLEAIFFGCQPILFKNIGSKSYIPRNLEEYFYIKNGSIGQVISQINSKLYLPKLSPVILENISRSVQL